MKIKVPQLPWHGRKKLELDLPDDWHVETCNMAGHDRPSITSDQIKAALNTPLGTPSLRQMAKGKKEVAVIIDDMTRGTRVYEIAPFVLEELAAAGIKDENIRFISALGLHGAMNRSDFVKKLGEQVVRQYNVYNHNAFGNCTYVGKTKTYETEVYLNEEVMKCDLKIGIGSVVPHPIAGFGGGSKLILPGVVSEKTIVQNHQKTMETAILSMKRAQEKKSKLNIGTAVYHGSPVVQDSDEAAEMVGFQFLINTLMNTNGESVAIYAGAFKEVHLAAVEDAEKHYLTPTSKDNDIVIANTFSKHNEGAIGLVITIPSLSQAGGDIVSIGNAPDGQITHYLCGVWGKDTYAPQYSNMPMPDYLNHLIVYNEYPDPGSRWFGPSEKILYMHQWNDVLDSLQKSHGKDTKVVVYPCADIQYTAA